MPGKLPPLDEILVPVKSKRQESSNRRVIATARTTAAMNAAAKSGLRPLLKQVVPNPEMKSRVMVFQNPQTGEVEVSGDLRFEPDGMDLVLSFNAYPYHFPETFAAYLLPSDLRPGEEVLLEDLIEDVVGDRWNQGGVYRLKSCPAIWTGTDFELIHEVLGPDEITMIG